jgi:hypothetical protein
MRWLLTAVVLSVVTFFTPSTQGAELKEVSQVSRAAQIKTMFDNIRAGTFGAEAPKLEWQDIPFLLQHADSQAPLKSVPFVTGGFRRGKNNPLTEGMLALYLVETVRVGADNSWNMLPEVHKVTEGPIDQQTAANVCGVAGDAPKPFDAQTELTKRYVEWWGRVKDTDRKAAAKDDPLQGAKMYWLMAGC